MERVLALLVEYDGTNYGGWQRQHNRTTVQSVLEDAAALAFGRPVGVVGSGRTDAGVHGRGQVAHIDVGGTANAIPTEKVARAFNVRLPFDVRIRAVADVASDFHARFQATSREYVYRIAKGASVLDRHSMWFPELPYDGERLTAAAEIFVGDHDFTTFSKHNADTRHYRCRLDTCRVEDADTHWRIRLRADRFVYGMCRAIVGAMMECARGAISGDELAGRLRAADRSKLCYVAPAHGLVLNRVTYPNDPFTSFPTF